MKKHTQPKLIHVLGIALVFVLLVPSFSHASQFSLYASYFETEDYADAVGFGGRLAFFDRVQLELGATYYDKFGNDFDFDLGDLGPQNVELELEAIPIDVGVRFNLGDGPVYLGGGGTYFLLAHDSGKVDDEFGLYARIGAQLGHFFIEGGYRDAEGTIEEFRLEDIGDDGIDLGSADFDLKGYFLNAGWRF